MRVRRNKLKLVEGKGRAEISSYLVRGGDGLV